MPTNAVPPEPAEAYLRPMQWEDLDAVVALHRVSFAMPWSRRSFAHELRNPYSRTWVAVGPKEQVWGLIVLWLLPPEAEIATLAVAPAHRGRGLGRRLLQQALAYACRQGAVHSVFLEVRADNEPALALYRAFDFRAVGRRRGYYRTPQGRVDAVLMRRRCGLGRPLP